MGSFKLAKSRYKGSFWEGKDNFVAKGEYPENINKNGTLPML